MTESPEQAIRWFHDEVQKLSAVAAGSLCLRKCPCIRKDHRSFCRAAYDARQNFCDFRLVIVAKICVRPVTSPFPQLTGKLRASRQVALPSGTIGQGPQQSGT